MQYACRDYHNRTRVEWVLDVPDDEQPADPNPYIEQREEEYDLQSPPEGGWWSVLRIEDAKIEGAAVLLKHPIPESWVVSVGGR